MHECADYLCSSNCQFFHDADMVYLAPPFVAKSGYKRGPRAGLDRSLFPSQRMGVYTSAHVSCRPPRLSARPALIGLTSFENTHRTHPYAADKGAQMDERECLGHSEDRTGMLEYMGK